MKKLEMWAGLECTLNRVDDRYVDQLEKNGHYQRLSDIGLFADLGVKQIRYPCLWEKVAPENLEKLKGILTYHVIAGKFDAATVIDAITKNKGKYTVTTVQGGKIDLSLKDGKVILTDANGKTSTVVTADVAASNGVIHAINTVVMPK